MRTMMVDEVAQVSGGEISGYQGAGAVLTVLGVGAAVATAPISGAVIGLAIGVAAGLSLAQWLAS